MARVLVFGSLNWDTPIRLSGALVPGGRLLGTSLGTSPSGRLEGRLGGGGANTGCGLVTAGHEVAVVATISTDETGERVLAEARARGLDTRFVTRTDRPTPTVLLLIDDRGERVIIGLDHIAPVTRAAEEAPRALQALLDFRPDALYLRRLTTEAARLAAEPIPLRIMEWPLRTAMPAAPSTLVPVHALTVSRDDLADRPLDTLWTEAQAMAGPRLETLIVTRGPEGALVITADGTTAVSTTPVTPQDTTGAGDAFAAGLIHARLAGLSWQDAAAHACAWGARTVADFGSLPPASCAELARRAGPSP